jgi:hypothetical protein
MGRQVSLFGFCTVFCFFSGFQALLGLFCAFPEAFCPFLITPRHIVQFSITAPPHRNGVLPGTYRRPEADPTAKTTTVSRNKKITARYARRRENAGDPEVLNSYLNRAIERLLKINREKGKVKQVPGQGAHQAEAA